MKINMCRGSFVWFNESHVEIWIHMWRKSVVFSSTFLCKILRFRRNLDFYISIYWNVKFASSHVNYTFTHAKILTYKKIMLNWTFSQLTFFLHMWKQNMAHRIPQICLFTCLFWHMNNNFQIWNWHFPLNDIDSSAISFFPHMWIKSSHA